MANTRPITLLHLSDLQFGPNHAFGQQDFPLPDAKFDSLLERLKDDLNDLSDDQDQKLIPDLVIVSGDLAERGMPSEFKQVRLFLEGIVNHLGIAREKVVVVPGNHDINRKECSAHFMSCSANEIQPDEPFSTKWQHYNEKLAKKFYEGTSIEFSLEEPWTWHVYTDLEVVVAGLNSTMAEIHDIDETDPLYKKFIKTGTYGHFGRIGEHQLKWFASKLEAYKEQGWLRIGVMHHNCRRGPTRDDENLRDVDLLKRLLGPLLNVLMHGHTHDGKLDWLDHNLPIVSTGSAAVKEMERLPGVPNQYQYVRIWPNQIERWTRRYDPGNKRWEGDTRCSKSGNDCYTHDKVEFEDVHGTFSPDWKGFHDTSQGHADPGSPPVNITGLKHHSDEGLFEVVPFVGRQVQLDQLRESLPDPDTSILTIHGPICIGKTFLVTPFLHTLVREGSATGVKIFAWTFLPRDDPHNPQASSDEFFEAALSFFGQTSVAGKGAGWIQQLVAYLRANKCILVLDAIDNLSSPGPATDLNVKLLLDEIATQSLGSGSLVITTSVPPVTQLLARSSFVKPLPVTQLPSGDALALLEEIRGTGLPSATSSTLSLRRWV